ncbi:hypothetical protein FB451DRAFT_1170259 [Mycena latifolia]|nr:hypothetical protein FB451DRAFT_1170259 [Mycena latifolia]
MGISRIVVPESAWNVASAEQGGGRGHGGVEAQYGHSNSLAREGGRCRTAREWAAPNNPARDHKSCERGEYNTYAEGMGNRNEMSRPGVGRVIVSASRGKIGAGRRGEGHGDGIPREAAAQTDGRGKVSSQNSELSEEGTGERQMGEE